jgi:ribonuclease HI
VPPPCSNNWAETHALQQGIRYGNDHGLFQHASLEIIGDSALVQGLLLRSFQSRNKILQPKLVAIQQSISDIPEVALLHVKRHRNKTADYLANEAMNKKTNHFLTAQELAGNQLQELVLRDQTTRADPQGSVPRLQRALKLYIDKVCIT